MKIRTIIPLSQYKSTNDSVTSSRILYLNMKQIQYCGIILSVYQKHYLQYFYRAVVIEMRYYKMQKTCISTKIKRCCMIAIATSLHQISNDVEFSNYKTRYNKLNFVLRQVMAVRR